MNNAMPIQHVQIWKLLSCDLNSILQQWPMMILISPFKGKQTSNLAGGLGLNMMNLLEKMTAGIEL